ncbi:melanophilin a [Alosa sapidissima]|uniref:melanophilin a n=1 Tax=Alosa sapidissima TaxID=34773 RepID=UPI001C0A03C2|nr:melanophilin a [Alosa sapidissima]XP_041936294.1 melanophilin a [Alosa sapidissima]
MDKKLDLTRLTDEEAKHIWDVIQRDFNLRKKEEDRLGQLKTQIEKEDTKRELLTSQSSLTESHCIHCLQPFQFLVNSKRQCFDCQLYTCKSCSRYSKKDHGWVCDPCRMGRLLKIGTLGWYHDNVRTRFKRFGSAKVMRSLYKRLNGERPREDDTVSMPEVRSEYRNSQKMIHQGEGAHNGHHDDDYMDATEAQRYKMMRKQKRLLSVHPLDFDVEEYMANSRRQSVQYIHEERGSRNDLDYSTEMYHQHRMNRRKSLDRYTRPDDGLYAEHRMVRARSLSKISAPVPQRQVYLDTSEEEDGFRYPVFQLPPRRRSSRASSQENINQPPPINELNKRMSAIESLLNRLEEKITSPPEPARGSLGNQQVEAEKLRRKLDELMSDRALSSDEEDSGKRSTQPKGPGMKAGPLVAPTPEVAESSSSSDEPTEAQKRSSAAALCDITTEVLRTINATESAMTDLSPSVPKDRPQLVGTDVRQADEAYRKLEENVYMAAGKSFDMEKTLEDLELSTRNQYGCMTDSELSELEDQVAKAAAKVQSTESEVSDIENRIASLNTTGLPTDKTKVKKTLTTSQRRKFSQDVATKPSNGSGFHREKIN